MASRFLLTLKHLIQDKRLRVNRYIQLVFAHTTV